MRFYLDIDDKVCFAIVNGNGYIVLYQEVDFSIKALDLLYSYLKPLDIKEMIVITHGAVSDRTLAGAGVVGSLKLPGGAKMGCQIPVADVEKIAHLIKVAGIPSVFIVDRIGYYTSFEGDKCYVEDDNGLYALLAVKDRKIVSYSRCSSTINTTAQSVCGRAGITECVDAYNLSNFDLLMGAFQNVHCINDPHALYELSLFAYATSDFAVGYKATIGEILDSRNYLKAPAAIVEEGEHVQEEQQAEPVHMEKQSKVKKKKRGFVKPAPSEIRREKTILDRVCIALTVLLLLAVGVSYGINVFTSREAIKFERAYTELSRSYADAESKVMMYRQYQEYDTLNPAAKAVYDYMLGSAEFDGEVLSVNINGSVAEVVFTCRSEGSFNQIVSDISLIDNGCIISEEESTASSNFDSIDYLEDVGDSGDNIGSDVSYKEGQTYRLSFTVQ